MDRPWTEREYLSLSGLERQLERYQKDTNQVFSIRSTEKLELDEELSGKEKKIQQRLKIQRRVYECTYGKERKTESLGVRNGRTRKRDCSARIVIGTNKKKTALIVRQIHEKHENHEELQQFVNCLPPRRRLDSSGHAEVEELLKLGVPKVEILKKVKIEYGKTMTRKDLDNIAQELRDNGEESIDRVVHILKNEYHAEPVVLRDRKQFKGLFFTTDQMRRDLALYPDICLVDGIYKLFKRGFVLMYLVVEDADCRTQIVGVGFLADEKEFTVKWMFEEFKIQHGDAANEIGFFMTDKDFVERDAIRAVFPGKPLYLCMFHTLKTFRIQVTEAKRSISTSKVVTSREFLNKLVKSKSREQYDEVYEKFCESCPESVVEYFNKNWHPCHEEWVEYWISEGSLGNLTNNRVESLNSLTKKFLKLNDAIHSAIHNLFKMIDHRNNIMNAEKIQNMIRRDRAPLSSDSIEARFKKILTPAAFRMVMRELKLHEKIDLQDIHIASETCSVNYFGTKIHVTSTECECGVYRSYKIPCKHIFAARSKFGQSLFYPFLCERWLDKGDIRPTEHDTETAETIVKPVLEEVGSGSEKHADLLPITEESTPKISKLRRPKKMNEKDKRALLEPILNNILYMTARCPDNQFNLRLHALEVLDNSWRNNEEIAIVSLEQSKNPCGGDERILNLSNALHELSLQDSDELATLDEISTKTDKITRIDEIVLPVPVKVIGRPRSAARATLPLLKNKLKSIVFNAKSEERQLKEILSWIIDSESIDIVMSGEQKLDIEHIPTKMEELSEPIMEIEVDIQKIKSYMKPRAFQNLKKLVQQKKKLQVFHCKTCRESLETKYIKCAGCLFRFHLHCVNRKKLQRGKDWFCAHCK